MPPVPLAANAIRTLIVDNLVIDAANPHTQTTIALTALVPAPVKGVYTMKPSLRADGPPARIPSALPPPGNLQLTVSALDILGSGRCGNVFEVDVCSIADADAHSPTFAELRLPELCLPELVIKVADPGRSEDLVHEASMYDEMESLQGVAVPRCYGWFEGTLQPSQRLITDNPDDVLVPVPQNRRVSVLLLEKMGGMLPVGERLPDRHVDMNQSIAGLMLISGTSRTDLWAIFSDLSQLGIEQQDMRYTNVLYAPDNSRFPGKICPYHGRVHSYRAIDFDRARKTDWTLKQHYYEHVGTLGRLLEAMEMNMILEPWEY